LVLVADRGLLSLDNLEALQAIHLKQVLSGAPDPQVRHLRHLSD